MKVRYIYRKYKLKQLKLIIKMIIDLRNKMVLIVALKKILLFKALINNRTISVWLTPRSDGTNKRNTLRVTEGVPRMRY